MMIKKIITIVLLLVLSFGVCTSAFAVETKVIERVYYGELKDGENLVCEQEGLQIIENVFVYYTFSIPQDGYFYLHYGTPHTSMAVEISGENTYDETTFNYDLVSRVYFLKKGNYELTVDVYSSYAPVNVCASYLGEEITDISFNYDLILDCDFDYYDDYLGVKNYFETTADATITFSSGKTYLYDDGTLYGTLDSEYKDGLNNVTVNFMDKSVPATITVYPISHYISDVEIYNIEDYYDKNLEYFNHLDETLPYGENIKVTFTDGSSKTATIGYNYTSVTMPNGQQYEIDFDVYYDHYFSAFRKTGNCNVVVEIGNATIKEYYFDGTKVSFTENAYSFIEQSKYCFESMNYNTNLAIGNWEDKEVRNYHLENVMAEFFELYMLFYDFIWYYTMFSFI